MDCPPGTTPGIIGSSHLSHRTRKGTRQIVSQANNKTRTQRRASQRSSWRGALGMAQRALGPVGAEAGEVLGARLFPRVSVSAALPVLAEAAAVPGALRHLREAEITLNPSTRVHAWRVHAASSMRTRTETSDCRCAGVCTPHVYVCVCRQCTAWRKSSWT